jgi:FkbM family methyltransferase
MDVGSEEAEFAAVAATIVGGSNVHLIEPSPRVWPNIKAIWEANELDTPYCFAGFAGSETRDAPEVQSAWPSQAYGDIQTESAFSVITERPDIPAITIDDYVRQTGVRPTVLLIDVEGAESLVLEGAKHLLQHLPTIFISIHPHDFISRFGHTQENVFRQLIQAGYDLTFLGEDHEVHYKVD